MKIISEESYMKSSWYAQIISGLKSEARKRRISLDIFSDIGLIKAAANEPIFVVGSDYQWLCKTVAKIQKLGGHPIILNNQQHHALFGKYSYVSTDIALSISYIIKLFFSQNKRKIALYGINSSSLADISRVSAFCAECDKNDVFYNDVSLEKCFDSFESEYNLKKYDAVICANDYAAASLLRHMKNSNINADSFSIISYSNTLLSASISPSLTSVSINYKNFASAAFMIASSVEKSPFITGMSVAVEWEIVYRSTLCKPTAEPQVTSDFEVIGPDSFYSDSELVEMMNIEKLLNHIDDTDREIIAMISKKKSYEKICEKCFLTETALKYRIKKLKEICKVKSKNDIMPLIEKYNIDLQK